MIIVDSCGWIEYFTDGPLADKFYVYLQKKTEMIIPIICLFEIYKKIKREISEEKAMFIVGQLPAGKIINFDEQLLLEAADLSLAYALPMSDSLIYAAAKQEKALLVTSAKHFKTLPGVKFIH
jgi:predicted nucleic acid-binding protein